MSLRRLKTLVLLTDFGPSSPYVGQMKLAFDRLAPHAKILDLAHDLPPQNLAVAWMVLRKAWPLLASGSLLLTVVDPGVGSARRVLLAQYAGARFHLLPENGLLQALMSCDPVYTPQALFEMNTATLCAEPSPVFHGRDLLAPLAAHLALGKNPAQFGRRLRIEDLSTQVPPALQASLAFAHKTNGPDRSPPKVAHVLYIDRFGNLITDLAHSSDLKLQSVTYKRHRLPLCTHYAQVNSGAPLALWSSYDFLEIAVRNGSAQRFFKAKIGDRISLG